MGDSGVGRVVAAWAPRRVTWVVTVFVTAAIAIFAIHVEPLSPPEDGEFYVVTGRDVSDTGIYARMVDEFNDSRPEDAAQARLVEVGGGADQHRAEMVRWLQTDGVRYDVLNIDNQWTAEFARAGWIEPVDVDTSDFLTAPLNAVHYDGVAQAVPFITDVGLLYYRSDLVPEGELVEGLGWPGVFRVLRETAAGDDDIEYGYAGQFAAYEGFTVNVLEIMWGHEAAPVAGDAGNLRASLTGGNELDALHRLAAALDNGTIAPGSVADTEVDRDTFDRFVDGEVVAMRNWPVWYDRLATYPGVNPATGSEEFTGEAQADDDAEPDGAEAEFDVKALPPGSAALGGQSLAVNSRSDHREDAVELIEFMTSAEQQRRLFYCGGFAPIHADAYSGPVELPCPGEDPADVPHDRRVEDRRGSYSELLKHEVEAAGLRPTTPYYPRFTQLVYGDLRDWLLSGGDESELPDIEDRLGAALAGA